MASKVWCPVAEVGGEGWAGKVNFFPPLAIDVEEKGCPLLFSPMCRENLGCEDRKGGG